MGVVTRSTGDKPIFHPMPVAIEKRQLVAQPLDTRRRFRAGGMLEPGAGFGGGQTVGPVTLNTEVVGAIGRRLGRNPQHGATCIVNAVAESTFAGLAGRKTTTVLELGMGREVVRANQ